MNLFRNPRAVRVLRPVITVLALSASVWHGIHAYSMWQQTMHWREGDPSLSDYFWKAFQSELAVTVVSFVAALIAWGLFRPRSATGQE